MHDNIDSKLIEIPGYKEPFRKDRSDRRGGGVCAYVTDNIVTTRLKDLEPPDIDLLWFELSLQNKTVILGVGYRPPGQSTEEVDQFLDQYQTSLNAVLARNSESVLIVGDFNDRCTIWDSNHVHSELKNVFHDLINMSDSRGSNPDSCCLLKGWAHK